MDGENDSMPVDPAAEGQLEPVEGVVVPTEPTEPEEPVSA